MRIPMSKPYRAFPELDAYSDEECVRYMRQAKRGRAMRALVLALGFGVGIVGSLCFGFAVQALVRLFPPADPEFFVHGFGTVLLASAILVGCLIPFVSAMLCADALIARRLRRRLRSTDCPSCGYLLIGQRPYVDEDLGVEAVRCPECGSRVRLGAGGLERENLMEPGARPEGLLGSAEAGAWDERSLVARFPELRAFGAATAGMVARVEAGGKRRQRAAVLAGFAAAAGVWLTVCWLVLWTPLVLSGPAFAVLDRGAVSRLVMGVVGVAVWPVGAWSKRVVRGAMLRSAVWREVSSATAAEVRR